MEAEAATKEAATSVVISVAASQMALAIAAKAIAPVPIAIRAALSHLQSQMAVQTVRIIQEASRVADQVARRRRQALPRQAARLVAIRTLQIARAANNSLPFIFSENSCNFHILVVN